MIYTTLHRKQKKHVLIDCLDVAGV